MHQSGCSLPPRRPASEVIGEIAYIFLVGFFIFTGGLKVRNALAAPVITESKHLKDNPDNVESLKKTLKEKISTGQVKEALEYVKRLSIVEPNELEWKILEAACYEGMGDLYTAKLMFREVLKKRPLSLGALHGLAMVMHKTHQGSAVIQMLERAVEHAHKKHFQSEGRSIRILIAHIHVIQGNLEEGLQMCDLLINEKPEDDRPYLCKAIIFGLLQREVEALEQLNMYRTLIREDQTMDKFTELLFYARSHRQLQRDH